MFDVVGVDMRKIEKLLIVTTKAADIDFGSDIEQICYGYTEKGLPPSRNLLHWCINNHEKLKQQDYKNPNTETDIKRKKLFAGCSETKNEALNLLNKSPIPQKAW